MYIRATTATIMPMMIHRIFFSWFVRIFDFRKVFNLCLLPDTEPLLHLVIYRIAQSCEKAISTL